MRKGFTLIELLLYLGISSVVLVSSTMFYGTVLQSRIKNQAISEVDDQGRQVMNLILQSIRLADTVNSPAINTSGSSLSINTTSAPLNPTVLDINSGSIRITEGVTSPVNITNSRITASALTVNNVSTASTPGSIQVQFTLTYKNSTGRNEYDYEKVFTGSASLRQP